jgi:hypothetical protein
MSLQIVYTKEEMERLQAKRAAKASQAGQRDADAAAAYKKALFDEVDGDEDRLIVFTMPEKFGGAVIHHLMTPEAWAAISKQVTRAMLSDGKKADTAASIASLVENTKLLVHPSLSELQTWREELPDLYSEIHNVMDARVSHGQSAGK